MQNYFNNLGATLESTIQDLKDNKRVSCFGMDILAKTAVVSRLANDKKTKKEIIVYVCDDYFVASSIYEQFKNCLYDSVAYLPHFDDILTYNKHSNSVYFDRLVALNKIKNGIKVLVTTIKAISLPVMSATILKDNCIIVKKDNELNLQQLSTRLIDIGYKKHARVETKGQFSIRGDILDIWSPNMSNPCRIDFFDNTVEQIKFFEAETQIGGDALDSFEIIPCSEWIATQELTSTLLYKLSKYIDHKSSADKLSNKLVDDIIIDLSLNKSDSAMCILWGLDGSNCVGLDYYLKEFYGHTVFIYDECKKVVDALDIIKKEHVNRMSMLAMQNLTLPKVLEYLSPYEWGDSCLVCHDTLSQNRITKPNAVYNFTTRPIVSYCHDYQQLYTDLLSYQNKGYQIYICVGDDHKKGIIVEWAKKNFLLSLEFIDMVLQRGGEIVESKKLYLGVYDLFKKTNHQKIKRSKASVFIEPEIGECVVHVIHGIGIYQGIQKHNLTGAIRDYCIVTYKDGDILYVPAENLDTLAKYVSEAKPQLNKIGGLEFKKVKEKVRQTIKQLSFDLVALYAEREKKTGHKYTCDEWLYKEFENRFEFEPTQDQSLAVEDFLNDMHQGKIMDRLLCGDVGYGKTEVAMRAAFRAVIEGQQVAFVSPTTILAKQHFNTITKRMSEFGVKIASLTRMDSNASINQSLDRLAKGEIDIVVGTHRVLSKDVIFKNLGLLILDEEQKFGVGDKEKIKNLKKSINVLALSATPIPRTLHMSLANIRDISILDTPPINRIPIQTYVAEYTKSLVIDAVNRELGRGGSVFVVYNRVESMPQFVSELQSLLPNARIVFANGQMEAKTLEDAILAFVDGLADILVASTIIENGIDMPNANTMIVVDSDKLGLSQMYQLRGRVGRSSRQAYAYFTYDDKKILTITAQKRLDAMLEFAQLGSGYKLSMRDLEIRGAGNVLGKEQHGHMDKVGYDMYCKLLAEEVANARGQSSSNQDIDIKIVTDRAAFIPDDYIDDETNKVNLYSRISRIESVAAMQQLIQEITDIYGKPPSTASNLIVLGLVKNIVAKLGAVMATLNKTMTSITFNKQKDIPKKIADMIKNNKCKFIASNIKPLVVFDNLKVMLDNLG